MASSALQSLVPNIQLQLALPRLCPVLMPKLHSKITTSAQWTWLQSISVLVIRDFMRIGTNSGRVHSRTDVTKADMPDKRAVRKACGNACQVVWLEPIAEDNVVGEVKELMIENGVHPAGVAVYWYGEAIGDAPVPKAAPNEKLVVHFHGGGYIMGSPKAGGIHEGLPRSILAPAQSNTPKPISRILNVEYRLTRTTPLVPSPGANAFPAALLDGLTVMHYLVYEMGFHPRDIVLSGDSAGGNVILGLTRYLRDAPLLDLRGGAPVSVDGDEIRSLMPGGMILLSPWCDVASTHIPERAGDNCSFVRNANTDIVGRYPYSKQRPELGMSSYALRGLGGKALNALQVARSPYLSPASLDLPLTMPISVKVKEQDGNGEKTRGTFEGYPPTYISIGGREILYDETVLLGKRIQDHATSRNVPSPSPPSSQRANGSSSTTSTPTNANTNGKNEEDMEKKNKVYEWVTIDEEPEMWHDFVGSPFSSVEGRRTMDRIAVWLAALPRGTEYPV